MKNNRPCLALLLALLLPAQGFALTSDKDQPMNIAADRVDIDDEKGTNSFIGNVEITRGSIRIKADRVVVFRDKEKNLDKMHSHGKPAHFQQTPDNKKEPVIAEADELFYDAEKEILIMRHNARIVQGGDTFTGDHIIYDSKRDKVTAKRARTAPGSDSSTGSGRVHITIQPKKKDNNKK